MKPAADSPLWTIDLSGVTDRLRARGVELPDQTEMEFRRFAALCLAAQDEHLAPSLPVDEFWHELVQDTRAYRLFCAESFGEFMDHVPDTAGMGMERQFERTLELYRKAFGAPSTATWSQVGNSMHRWPGISLR